MRNWLPWACIAVSLIAVAAMPWRRPDPHHEFIFHLLTNLEDESATVGSSRGASSEVDSLGHRTAASNSHRSSGLGV